ncbi:Nuclear envelope pore membrane protein POM 121C [Manis javanica]|nr:Nuclear envelope pore membrane protein POM 121C [Manis javanica]
MVKGGCSACPQPLEEEEKDSGGGGRPNICCWSGGEKKRCHDSSGSGHSAFKPEVADGVPAAFVPEPGPLKRGLSSQSSDGELCKRTCTSAMSCSKGMCTCGIRMSSRNAITSSYTSTGGISQLWKRRPSASPFSSPASSRSQTPESPEKKMREEDGPQGSGSSAPPVNKESQGEQDTTTWREQNSWDSPVTPSSSQPCRCKFPLVPSRRGIPLMLPPAPWIGRLITVEEYYQEKQAQSQWLKRIFEDKTSIISGFGAVTQTTSCGTNTSVTPQDTSWIAAITLAFGAMTLTTSSETSRPEVGRVPPEVLTLHVIFPHTQPLGVTPYRNQELLLPPDLGCEHSAVPAPMPTPPTPDPLPHQGL